MTEMNQTTTARQDRSPNSEAKTSASGIQKPRLFYVKIGGAVVCCEQLAFSDQRAVRWANDVLALRGYVDSEDFELLVTDIGSIEPRLVYSTKGEAKTK